MDGFEPSTEPSGPCDEKPSEDDWGTGAPEDSMDEVCEDEPPCEYAPFAPLVAIDRGGSVLGRAL